MSQDIGTIEVGDTVERYQGGYNHGYKNGEHFVVLKVEPGYVYSPSKDGLNESVPHDINNVRLIKKANSFTNMALNLIEKFKLSQKKEPEKSFIKAGISNMDGTFTTEGQNVFLSFLLQKNGDDFKKEVVDDILAADEEKA